MQLTNKHCFFCNLRIAPYEPYAEHEQHFFHMSCLLKHLTKTKSNGTSRNPVPPNELFHADKEV